MLEKRPGVSRAISVGWPLSAERAKPPNSKPLSPFAYSTRRGWRRKTLKLMLPRYAVPLNIHEVQRWSFKAAIIDRKQLLAEPGRLT